MQDVSVETLKRKRLKCLEQFAWKAGPADRLLRRSVKVTGSLTPFAIFRAAWAGKTKLPIFRRVSVKHGKRCFVTAKRPKRFLTTLQN